MDNIKFAENLQVHVCMHLFGVGLKKCIDSASECCCFFFFNFSINYSVVTHCDLHSTADEPLAETPPEEAAQTASAPLVEDEGKLGKGVVHLISF